MSEHDEEEHEEGHDEEPWLVSYADMMTLLFGFFVVLYSFASAKLGENTVQMRKEVASYFGGGVMNSLESSMEKFKKKMEIEGSHAIKNMGIKLYPEGAEIAFQSTALFRSGKAEIDQKAKHAIKALISHVSEEGNKDKWDVTVEGHTDDVPIKKSKIFPSNWELSGARASAVIRLFEEAGFVKKQLRAIGFADTRPVVPHRKDNVPIIENRQKNRRILIKIMMTDQAQVDEFEKGNQNSTQ